TEQDFQSFQPAAGGELRLIGETKVAIDQSKPQLVRSEDHGSARLLCNVGIMLADVHRMVGHACKFLGGSAVLRISCIAEARRSRDDGSIQVECMVEAGLQAADDGMHPVERLRKRKDDDELVAAYPGKKIHWPELISKPGTDLLQVEIADLMAILVIDVLEAIDIDVDYGEPAAALLGPLKRIRQTALIQTAIRQLRQRIVCRVIHQPLI